MASGGSRHAKSKINEGVNGGELMKECIKKNQKVV